MLLLMLCSLGCTDATANTWWAEFDSNALGGLTDTTVLVVGDAHGVLLGNALRVLGSAFSLSEGDFLADFDGSGNVEDSGLDLSGEGSMSSLSTLAALGLACLVELGVGNGSEGGQLGDLSLLLEALAHTATEAWELREFAGALKRRKFDVRELVVAISEFELPVTVGTLALCLSKVLGVVLSQSVLKRRLRRSGCDEAN